MKIRCVWEHNGNDSMLYAENCIGAFTRGKSKEEAVEKMPSEISSYLKWTGKFPSGSMDYEIVQDKPSELAICDADSEVLFDEEKKPLSMDEYKEMKNLALKSAQDFLTLYQAIPDKDKSHLPIRKTFYGQVPRTAVEMYEHTKNVNSYYFSEIGIEADNDGSIAECRRRGFELLERHPDFLKNEVREGSYGEYWSLRKVMRRFVWHDRIHAKAMYRMAVKVFGTDSIPNVFLFEI